MNSNGVSVPSTSTAGLGKNKKVSLSLNKKSKKIEMPCTELSNWDDAVINAAADELLNLNNNNMSQKSRDIIRETGISLTREDVDIELLTPDIFNENIKEKNDITTNNNNKINILEVLTFEKPIDIGQFKDLEGIEPLPLSLEQNGQVWDIPSTSDSNKRKHKQKFSQISQDDGIKHDIMKHFFKIRKEHVCTAQQKLPKLKNMLRNIKDKKMVQEFENFFKINQNIYFAINEEESLHQYFSYQF